MTSGGVQLYSTPMVLAIVGYALAWVLRVFPDVGVVPAVRVE